MVVFDPLEIHLDLLACLELSLELGLGNDTVALEADIDDNILFSDADDPSGHDFVGRHVRERLLDERH